MITTGTTTNGGHRYYQSGPFVIQININGEWHGYRDTIWNKHFPTLQAALDWLEDKDKNPTNKNP